MKEILQIGLDSAGKIVSVFNVPTGIKCNCTCPECGEKLEAKNKDKNENTILKGNQKKAHFAHLSGRVCEHATESALHRIAKEVLLQYKTLRLPEIHYYHERVNEATTMTFDEVELEKRIEYKESFIIPDAILKKGKSQLLVEFYKTHLVDSEKKEKLIQIQISTIEIDLNFIEPIVDGKVNYEGVKKYLEADSSFRRWLYNSKGRALYLKKENESTVKPMYSLAFLERQDEIDEEERTNLFIKKERNREFERWKKERIKEGWQPKKIYEYVENHDIAEYVFCPKEPKHQNKKQLKQCKGCKFYLCDCYDFLEKSVLCGFSANLLRKSQSSRL